MFRLIAVLLLIPLLDMLLLVGIGTHIGFVPTIALVVLTGLVGLMLVRAEGRHTLAKIQRKAVQGDSPTDELLDGALLLVAGAFLLTPGLVTDVIGFIFVLPPTRYPVRVALKKWVVTPYIDKKTGGFATGSVYVGGFPGDEDVNLGGAGGPNGPGGGSGGPGGPGPGSEGDVRDIGEARDVDDADDDRRT
ncbi:FxsA family protein [Halorhabdus amylolytica]|uniref:FxsA family protein n=1 Tax=Halorhabdus amylolytica TaxID=2559573 RepID=UPI0010A9D5E6|nr:FxsA family protein [Halorhabdus amylolytica]